MNAEPFQHPFRHFPFAVFSLTKEQQEASPLPIVYFKETNGDKGLRHALNWFWNVKSISATCAGYFDGQIAWDNGYFRPRYYFYRVVTTPPASSTTVIPPGPPISRADGHSRVSPDYAHFEDPREDGFMNYGDVFGIHLENIVEVDGFYGINAGVRVNLHRNYFRESRGWLYTIGLKDSSFGITSIQKLGSITFPTSYFKPHSLKLVLDKSSSGTPAYDCGLTVTIGEPEMWTYAS